MYISVSEKNRTPEISGVSFVDLIFLWMIGIGLPTILKEQTLTRHKVHLNPPWY